MRNQTPRYAYRKGTLGENQITYGRFSEDSSLTCRLVTPARGKPCYLILRAWKSPEAWQRFAASPPAAVQLALDEGCGVILPLLFGQRSAEEVQAYREAIEDSYLFTSYNRTTHQHQAGDIVTTVRLAEVEMKIRPKNLAIVADRDLGLTAFAAWAFLCSKAEIGPFVGDLRGVDLTNPASWVRHAYLPLVLRGGGVEDLTRLCEGRKANLTGVRGSCRQLFSRQFKVEEKPADLAGLLTRAAKLAG